MRVFGRRGEEEVEEEEEEVLVYIIWGGLTMIYRNVTNKNDKKIDLSQYV